MWRRIVILVFIIVVVFAGLLGYSYFGNLTPPEGIIEIPIEVNANQS